MNRAIIFPAFGEYFSTLRKYFDAFDDSVLGLNDFQRVLTYFKTGAGFGDIFKMFQD